MIVGSSAAKKHLVVGMVSLGYVRVRFDPRVAGVEILDRFKYVPCLALDYGSALTSPTVDMDVTDEGIAATLLFSGAPSKTFIPWNAVFMLECDLGQMTFEDDMPPELRVVASADEETVEHVLFQTSAEALVSSLLN